jgi:hypothetical protein
MYRIRSSDFCACGWWKSGVPGAVRGTSTATCRSALSSSLTRSAPAAPEAAPAVPAALS